MKAVMYNTLFFVVILLIYPRTAVSKTDAPSVLPTSQPTSSPTSPSSRPTSQPSIPTNVPTNGPTFFGVYSNSLTLSSAPTENWECVAVSSTGQFLAAAAYGNGIFTSQNFGYDWSKSNVPSLDISGVTISANGRYIYAYVFGGPIYMSSDFGSDWTQSNAPDHVDWNTITTSNSGQYVFAVVYGTNEAIYLSSDFGSIWTTSNVTSDSWTSIACSSSGQYVFAVDGTNVYSSFNYGVGFNIASAVSDCYIIACSSTGQYLAVASETSGIFLSQDFGYSFALSSAPQKNWFGVTSDSSGQYLYANSHSDGVYYSYDFGNNWEAMICEAFPTSGYWSHVSTSSSGQYIAATVYGVGIYINLYTPSSAPSSQPTMEPNAQPTSYPSVIPSAAPTRSPNQFPTSFPTSIPSQSPSRQPSGQPSCQPISLPTSQPSFQPSSYPTYIPDTLKSTHIVQSVSAESTYVFNNLGYMSSAFLSVNVIVSYLDINSKGHLNITAVNGNNSIIVSEICAPLSTCGSVSCAINIDVTSVLSNEGGGSLTVIANSVNASEHTGVASICTYNGVIVLYALSYTLSVNPAPTAYPTVAPTEAGNFVFEANPNTPFYVIGTMVLLFTALGVWLVRLRDRTGFYTDEKMTSTCVDLAMIGYHLSAEAFYIVVLFHEGLRTFGTIIIVIRSIGVIPAIYFIVSISSTRYNALLKTDHLFKNASIYSLITILMVFEPSLVRYYPWEESDYTKRSRGFPDQHLFKVCVISRTCQLLSALIVQVVVVANSDAYLFHDSSASDKIALVLVILYLISSILAVIFLIVTNTIRLRVGGGTTLAPSDELTSKISNPVHRSIDGTEMKDISKVSSSFLLRLSRLEEREILLDTRIAELNEKENMLLLNKADKDEVAKRELELSSRLSELESQLAKLLVQH